MPILNIKRHKKNTQAKILEKITSWQHALLHRLCHCCCCSPVDPAAADGQKDRSLSFVCPIPSTHHMGRCWSTLAISRKLMREEQCARRTKLMRIRSHLPRHVHSSQLTSWRELCNPTTRMQVTNICRYLGNEKSSEICWCKTIGIF